MTRKFTPREFSPDGLPDYTIKQERGGPRDAWGWTVYSRGVHTFEWNDATCSHDRPVYRDWVIEWRPTAKAAVAAAHAHARWLASYAPECVQQVA